MTQHIPLYLITILTAFGVSFVLTPIVRAIAIKKAVLDAPSSAIKTHKVPTPSLGGVAIAAGFFAALAAVRLFTNFPTGTLRNLRGIFIAGFIMAALGFVDDITKPRGVSVGVKFIFQFLAAAVLIFYGIKLHFIQPHYIAIILSLVWTVGVANALNIIDIMDGFASSQVVIAALMFLLISLPSEALYVNFAAAALMGAAAGFIPFNLSSKRKIFMGDSGSLFMGLVLAALAMGTQYDRHNPLGVYAPLFILAIPIYDTFFVAIMRMLHGHSPFMGSKDHYALRLEKLGMSRTKIVILSALAALFLGGCAVLVTMMPLEWALWVYLIVGGEFLLLSIRIAKIRMD